MSDLQTLTDMGFSQERAARALEVTSNKGVEPAMEWLLAHADEDIPSEQSAPAAESVAAAAAAAAVVTNAESGEVDESAQAADTTETSDKSTAEAKSFKCNDCDRLFKSQLEIEFHAAKSGHSNFSESTEEKKPLTEEEKKEQLARLEEKLRQKRREREEQEKTDALEREKLRIKSGKDMSEAKRKMEEIEMQKIVEQRKREKQEEKVARERVRAQIEADKMARKARIAAELGQPAPVVVAPVQTQSSQNSIKASTAANYTKTKIQVRLQDGSTLAETFDVKESLSAVRLFIQLKQGETIEPFSLMTSFPRRVFTDDDYEKPLDVLGLVPSAVVIVTKK